MSGEVDGVAAASDDSSGALNGVGRSDGSLESCENGLGRTEMTGMKGDGLRERRDSGRAKLL